MESQLAETLLLVVYEPRDFPVVSKQYEVENSDKISYNCFGKKNFNGLERGPHLPECLRE